MFSVRAKNLVSSISAYRCISHSSAAARNSTTDETHFMVNYLIDSLGFSTNEAISTSSKLTRLKSSQKPDSVIDLFRRYGFDDTHIKSLVISRPELLLCNPDKTLDPKLALFKGLSMSGPRLVELVNKNPWVLKNSLDNRIVPHVRYLTELLGGYENVVKAVNRSSWLLSGGFKLKNVKDNVGVLRGCGLSDERIHKFLLMYPRPLFFVKPEILKYAVLRVEEDLHIPRDSGMFIHGVETLCYVTKDKLDTMFGIFRSFGWSDFDIYVLARTQPRCLSMSDSKLGIMLSFYMKEMGCKSASLATCPALLMMSLDKRVKPRVKVLKILQENELVNFKLSLSTLLTLSESKFVERFILHYKKEIPDLLEVYTNILKQ